MTSTELEVTEWFQGLPSQAVCQAGNRQGGDTGAVLVLSTFFQRDTL